MNDKIRKEIKDMLERVSKEKEYAEILYEKIWSEIIYSYYCSIAYNYNTKFGITYRTNLTNELIGINKDASASYSMIQNILLHMIREDGFEIDYSGESTIFTISVEKINELIKSDEEKKHTKSKNSKK